MSKLKGAQILIECLPGPPTTILMMAARPGYRRRRAGGAGKREGVESP